MSQHKITAQRSGSHPTMGDWEAEYEITFKYTKGSPDYWNKAGGHWEQGWGPEIEFVSIKPDAGDHGAFSDLAQKDLEDWAQMWLDDAGYDAAIQIATSDLDV